MNRNDNNTAATTHNTIEVRFHGLARTCKVVGTLKNGLAIGRLVMPSNGNVYYIHRKAKNPSAKGYTQGTDITIPAAAAATWANAAEIEMVRRWINNSLESLDGVQVRCAAKVDRETAELNKLLAHDIGAEIPVTDNAAVPYQFSRRDSDMTMEGTYRVVMCSNRWNEKHSDWKSWLNNEFTNSFAKRFSTMDTHADEIAKAQKEAKALRVLAEGFEARHAAPTTEAPTTDAPAHTGLTAILADAIERHGTMVEGNMVVPLEALSTACASARKHSAYWSRNSGNPGAKAAAALGFTRAKLSKATGALVLGDW